MTTVDAGNERPAMRRLAQLGEHPQRAGSPHVAAGSFRAMGYQPSLDGLRAISVITVMLYHAGFSWMVGGFFGVEVFFVISGYLITALLLDERERNGVVSVKQFWVRRARRLLPAVMTMLVVVAVWAALFGTDEQQSTLRRDLPWSIFYLSNWGQITGTVPYFAAADPPLLRHLWSLAVEEQWYLIWPLVFVAAFAFGSSGVRVRGRVFVSAAFGLMALTFVLHAQDVSTNFLYLSTITRASGLLLGAGCAFLWRPWRAANPSPARGRRLDVVGAAAVTLLVCVMTVAVLTEGYIYQWVMPLVSVLAMAAVAVVVYPAATGMRAVFGWKPLVEIGQRSYGLYLWHWPVFVIGKVDHSASWPKFVIAMGVTAALSELCLRYIETPIRKGGLSRWFRELRRAMGAERIRRERMTRFSIGGGALVVVALLGFYASVDHFDPAKGGDDASFTLDPTSTTAASPASIPVVVDPSTGVTTQTTATSPAATQQTTAPEITTTTIANATTTLPVLPRSVVVVGDSQAHSLAINLPDGIGSTFSITDGSVEGCGVFDAGRVISQRNFRRSFGDCAGWAGKWGSAASSANAQVALVVLGAWDVFDLELEDRTLVFGTPEFDAHYLAQLQQGIDALRSAGSHVALLEAACMRPKDVQGAGVPALPERGDDARIAHINALLRQAATTDPANITFVSGPTAWCNDEAISTDLGYRWDGVHVYKPGANLIYETIAPALLGIPL